VEPAKLGEAIHPDGDHYERPDAADQDRRDGAE
jgi:hypothetical protein